MSGPEQREITATAAEPAGEQKHVAACAEDKVRGELHGTGADSVDKPDAGPHTFAEKALDEVRKLWATEADKANSSKSEGKTEAAAERSGAGNWQSTWFERTANAVGYYFKDAYDFVQNGFSRSTHLLGDTWAAVLQDKDHQSDIRVRAKLSGDELKAVLTEDNLGSRLLSPDELRYKDKQGNTIIENRKTREIISQSADGKTIYERRADGTEVVRDENGQTVRDKASGNYTRIDYDGTITEIKLDRRDPQDQQVITRFDQAFAIAQKRTRFALREAHGRAGDNFMFTNGLCHIHENGVRSLVSGDGTHIIDEKLGELRVSKGKLEVLQADGHYLALDANHPLACQVRKSMTAAGKSWASMSVQMEACILPPVNGSVTPTTVSQLVARINSGAMYMAFCVQMGRARWSMAKDTGRQWILTILSTLWSVWTQKESKISSMTPTSLAFTWDRA